MIAAAGSGQRLGAGGPKAFVELAGRPLIEWSLLALAAAETVEGIVVAAPNGFKREVETVAGGSVHVVTGGPSRAESVLLAMKAVKGDLVVVHDAARPLVTAGLVDRVVRRLASSGADGVIAAAPVGDSLKRAGEGGAIGETVDRRGLWGAQTPQAFRVAALQAAQRAAQESGELEAATDEAWLIERIGGRTLLEPTGAANLKVTVEDDVALAAAMLGSRGA